MPQPAKPTEEAKQPLFEDCLSCRLTGSAAFTGLGLYALNQGRLQGALKKVRPPGAPMVNGQVSLLLGVVFCGLGIGRLFV